jgi:hypothetical protein
MEGAQIEVLRSRQVSYIIAKALSLHARTFIAPASSCFGLDNMLFCYRVWLQFPKAR